MKKTMIGLSSTLLIMGMVGTVSASTMFSIDNVLFTDINGANEQLQWAVVALGNAAIPDFTLAPGQTKTFTYGTFTTNDFDLENNDLSDNDDTFKANFAITPPGTNVAGTADVDGYIKWSNNKDYLEIDFNNNYNTVLFGTGGKYQYKFNDLTISRNGPYSLTADLNLIADPSAAPVPEPGTLLLMGAGLAGLVGYNRKRKK